MKMFAILGKLYEPHWPGLLLYMQKVTLISFSLFCIMTVPAVIYTVWTVRQGCVLRH